MEEDTDVPPLEDMSDAFSSCLRLREEKKSNVPYQRNEVLEVPDNAEKLQSQRIEKLFGKDVNEANEHNNEMKKETNKKPETYCGFKKGFLTASNRTSKKNKQNKKEVEEITAINKNVDMEKNVLSEVQNAMNQQIPFLKSNEWVTEDLLSKISENPKLLQRFLDPRFVDVIQKFQSNPQEIMRMCESNPEMKEFVQDFCSIMGDHFTKLGETQEEQKSGGMAEKKSKSADSEKRDQYDEEKKMKAILSDPEIACILKSAEIQRLMKALKEEPNKAQKLLQSADASFRKKIQKLIDVGLLQMAV